MNPEHPSVILPPASHAPYKWDYWPHDDVRAECRFVGLTNLGATCYLASTIQQLYMIPEARQAVFTAKVSTCNTNRGHGALCTFKTECGFSSCVCAHAVRRGYKTQDHAAGTAKDVHISHGEFSIFIPPNVLFIVL